MGVSMRQTRQDDSHSSHIPGKGGNRKGRRIRVRGATAAAEGGTGNSDGVGVRNPVKGGEQEGKGGWRERVAAVTQLERCSNRCAGRGAGSKGERTRNGHATRHADRFKQSVSLRARGRGHTARR